MRNLGSVRVVMQEPLEQVSIDEHDLLTLHRRLTAAATRKGYRHCDAEDASSDALVIAIEILKGIETSRTWPLGLGMYQFCKGIVRSKLSTLRRSAGSRRMVDFNDASDSVENTSIAPDQERVLVSREMLDGLKNACRNDPLALDIIRLHETDAWPSQAVAAQKLGIDLNTLRAGLMRVRRRGLSLEGGAS